MLRNTTVLVNGLSIHTRVAAPEAKALGIDTLPVVLVHGYVVSSRYMAPFARQLAGPHGPHCVYAPDLPGTGKSAKPPRVLNLIQLAETLADWMEVMGLHRADVIAHSLGCQIAVHLVCRYPERVRRLVLIGPTVDAGGRTPLSGWPEVG